MIMDLAKIVWRRRYFVASFTLAFLLLVLIALLMARLTYEAMAVVRIVKLSEPTSGMTREEGLQEKLAFIETHKRMITSRAVLTKLVRRMPSLQRWVPSDSDYREELIVRKLERSIQVRTVRFTDLLELVIRTRTKDEVARVANTLVEVYQEWLGEETAKHYGAVSEFLGERLDFASKRLDEDEARMHAAKKRYAVVSLESEIKDKLKTVHALETEISDLEAKTEYLRDLLGKLAKDKTAVSLFVSLADNETLRELAKEYDQLDLHIRLMGRHLEPAHPKYRELLDRRDNLAEKLHVRLVGYFESQLLQIDVQRAKKEGELAHYRQGLYRLREIDLEMEKLERRFRMDEKAYLNLLDRYQESEVLQAKKSLVAVLNVSPAVEPIKHVLPKRKRGLIMGMVLGFLLALALAVLRERLETEVSLHAPKPQLQSPLS
jgi:uncharacterized protein involved in exopolysaccharide biosynthesis